MPFSLGSNAGLKALTTARLAIQTAGNNVANANTPGYSRQRVSLSSDLPFRIDRGFQVGTGVRVTNIDSLVDEGLERRIRQQLSVYSMAGLQYSRLQEVEGVIGEPDNGLSNDLTDWFGAIGALQTDPADRALRGGAVQTGQTVADNLNLLANRFGELQDDTFREVGALARQINEAAQQVANLNAQITSLESGGTRASGLRDNREQLIKEISSLVDVRALERNTGSVDLIMGGSLLVAGERTSELSVNRNQDQTTGLVLGKANAPVNLKGGRIAALLEMEQSRLPMLREQFDQFANNMILEFNRLHSTGVPGSGPFQSLNSTNRPKDGDGDGRLGDELLNQAGFPFPINDGELFISVTNNDTGDIEQTRIAINPNSMSIDGLAAEISKVGNISATVDPTGKLRIAAQSGYGFDFSPQLDSNPDSFGTLGGAAPSLGAGSPGPYDLSAQTFPVTINVTTGTAASPTVSPITLDASDFRDPSNVTVDELVTAINGDIGSQATAKNVGGYLQIRSDTEGAVSQLTIADATGTAAAALGIPAGTVAGQGTGVNVEISGTYEGSTNGKLIFQPLGSGQIGVDAGLQVQVFNEAGQAVGVLDVGAGYEAGTPIEVADGVKVAFGPGTLDATANQRAAVDTLADSDTSDVLVAMGLNTFFEGDGAANISVQERLRGDPELLSASLSDASGDAGNLQRMLDFRDASLSTLNNNSLEEFYQDIVGEVGFDTATAEAQVISEETLLDFLQTEREAISGVNLDEELIDLQRYQESYEAAARFMSVVNELSSTLINLGR